MEWFEALILGIIQGLTEYLPVSSSGHLAIGSALFGIEGEENLAFTVVVHVATVFSTLVVLWKEMSKGFIISCKLSLTLYNVDINSGLVICCSREDLALLGRDGCISLDQSCSNSTHRLDRQ